MEGTGAILLKATLEVLCVGFGFFLLGKVKPEKFTGAPLYMAECLTVFLTRRDLRTPPVIVAGVGLEGTA